MHFAGGNDPQGEEPNEQPEDAAFLEDDLDEDDEDSDDEGGDDDEDGLDEDGEPLPPLPSPDDWTYIGIHADTWSWQPEAKHLQELQRLLGLLQNIKRSDFDLKPLLPGLRHLQALGDLDGDQLLWDESHFEKISDAFLTVNWKTGWGTTTRVYVDTDKPREFKEILDECEELSRRLRGHPAIKPFL